MSNALFHVGHCPTCSKDVVLHLLTVPAPSSEQPAFQWACLHCDTPVAALTAQDAVRTVEGNAIAHWGIVLDEAAEPEALVRACCGHGSPTQKAGGCARKAAGEPDFEQPSEPQREIS